MFCCWRTAMRCPGEGLIGRSPRRTSPSTTLPWPTLRQARAGSRGRNRGPSRPACRRQTVSRIARSSVGITTSKPTTLAPPSSVAASTRPISPVQVSIGEPLNGAVRRLSSSIATTTAGEAAGSCLRPNSLPAQRGEQVEGEAVDRPGDGRNRGRRADQRDGGDHKPVARGAPDSQDVKMAARHAYSMRSRRPTIGVAPGLACGSTRNTICDDLNVAA